MFRVTRASVRKLRMSMENKKTKRVAEEDQLEVEEEREVKRKHTLSPIEKLEVITKEEVEALATEWFNGCDPSILFRPNGSKAAYGWGYHPVPFQLIKAMVNCSPFYTREGEAELEKDEKLFDGIAPLHVIHAIAKRWWEHPWVCYGSYELSVLFHVLRHYILPGRMGPIITRLLQLTHHYSEHGDIGWEVKPMVGVPYYAKHLVKVMFYSNLALLVETPDGFQLITEDIKNKELGFRDVVRSNLFPEMPISRGEPESFINAVDAAGKLIIDSCNTQLAINNVIELEPKPLKIVTSLHYDVV